MLDCLVNRVDRTHGKFVIEVFSFPIGFGGRCNIRAAGNEIADAIIGVQGYVPFGERGMHARHKRLRHIRVHQQGFNRVAHANSLGFCVDHNL